MRFSKLEVHESYLKEDFEQIQFHSPSILLQKGCVFLVTFLKNEKKQYSSHRGKKWQRELIKVWKYKFSFKLVSNLTPTAILPILVVRIFI